MGWWIGKVRVLTYRDEAIGEQQPTSSVLYDGEEKGQRTGGRRSDGTRKRWGWTWYMFYRRNLNIQRPKVNYSYVVHPTSESSMWISKWLRFDEIFASAVSDRPSEQRFKKSNLCQLRSLFLIFVLCYMCKQRNKKS
jgi:hypothetical protein